MNYPLYLTDYWEVAALLCLLYAHVFDGSAWQLQDGVTNYFDFSTD